MNKNWDLIRLFESVNRVSISEESDIKQLNEIDWSGDFKDVKKVCIPPDSLKQYLNDVLKKKDAKPKDKEDFGLDKPHVHASRVNKTEEGDIDIENFIQTITDMPNEILSVNGKMEKSETENQIVMNIGIPALRGLVYDVDGKEFYYVNTCPGAGSCAPICYARKHSYIMFPDVFVKQTRILNLLLNDPDKFKYILLHELEIICNKYRKMDLILRWNDAGDFFTNKYYEIAKEITKTLQMKGFKFKSYGYSKMSNVVNDPDRPKDFTINFSDDANKRETSKINTEAVKRSVIVPKEIFSDLLLRNRNHYAKDERGKVSFNSPKGLDILKQRLADKYGVDKKTIISYDKMLSIPEGNEQIWNVIVMPSGDGDVSAQRSDVKITFLLEH